MPYDFDIAVIGGGQSGLAFAFALRRAGIGRVTVLDVTPPVKHRDLFLIRSRRSARVGS